MFGVKLEKLLERLFDDEESADDDVSVLKWRTTPPEALGCCCSHNYACYNG